jgi:hypothetical protein
MKVSFFEDVTIYSEITNLETGYKHTKKIEKTIAPNSSELYRIDWNTINLWTGRYNYKVIVIHNNVPNKGDFVAFEPINLVFPQEFDLDVSLTKPKYEVGENIEIRATATRLQKSVEDVIVTANIEKPDGSVEELLFEYDDSSEQYKAQLRANIGGNYYIDAHGERKYYFSDSESELGQVIVEVSPQIDSTKNRLYEYETVDLHMGPVGGLQGFATNVILSNTNFALEDVLLYEIWNNPNKQLTNNGNSSVLGITNLGDENRINAYSGSSIASLALKSKVVGESALSLSNTSFIDYKGNAIATRVTNDVTLKSEEQKAILSLNTPNNSILKGKYDTLSVGIINAYKVFGTELSIGFDPEKIEVKDVIEGSYINDYGTHQSLLVKSIDNDNGLINLGLTRSNTQEEVDKRTGLLANILYRAKGTGEVDFNYNKNMVFTSSEGENLPAITSNHSIEILPLPDSLKGLITLKQLTSKIDNTNELEIGFLIENIESISTFATDLTFDSSLLEFQGLTKGSYFNEHSSLLYENKPDSGIVTIGISNLNASSVSDGDIDTMMVATFKFKDVGEANFALNNTGVFDDSGESIELNSIDTLNIDYATLVPVNQVIPELKFLPDFTFSNDQNEVNLSIAIDSVSNLYSFAGDIYYDPSILTFQTKSEGDFFNEEGTVQTSLVIYDDNQNGVLTLGLSRLGETEGVSTDSSRIIANLTFIQVGEDSTEVNFSNTGLLLPDGESEIEHETNKTRIGQLGDGFVVTPRVISPINSTISAGQITFNWENHKHNDEFKLQISDTSSYSNVIVDTTLTQNSFTKEFTSPDTYYWRLKSSNDYGESNWANASFRTEIEIPEPVNLTLPSDASQNINLTPYFEWNSLENAQTYNFQLSKTSSFDSLLIDSIIVGESNLVLTDSLDFRETYYWRLKAENYGVSGLWSEVWEFTTIVEAPGGFVLKSPEENSSFVSVNPEFIWQRSQRAEQYRLQVSMQSDFGSLGIDSLLTDTTALVIGLRNGVSHYWRVKAINAGGETDWSPSWEFTTIPLQPNVVELLSPVNGANDLSLTPRFKWRLGEHANSFTFELASDEEFTEVLISESTEDTTTALSDILENNSRYYWRVRGENSGVSGLWSEIRSFVTIIAEPEQVELESPGDGEELIPVTPVLSWLGAERAESYRVRLSTREDFVGLVLDSVVTDTSMSIQNPLNNDTEYYWQVKAINKAGESNWSNIQNFSTREMIPEVVVLKEPQKDSVHISINPSLRWFKSERAKKYHVNVSLDSMFKDLKLDSITVDTALFIEKDFDYNTNYYWRVKASNNGGESNWSKVFSFKTIVPLPKQVKILAPKDSTDGVELMPKVVWSSDLLSDGYTLQIGLDSLFENIVLDSTKETSSDTSLVLKTSLDENTKYFIRVRSFNVAGYSNWSSISYFRTNILTSNDTEDIPTDFVLQQNYPNPFNPSTTVRFAIPKAADVNIVVYNMIGQRVAIILNERKSPGWHNVRFNASNLASGFYIYRMVAGNFVEIRKMTLIK